MISCYLTDFYFFCIISIGTVYLYRKEHKKEHAYYIPLSAKVLRYGEYIESRFANGRISGNIGIT
jgi:hypothetical protein